MPAEGAYRPRNPLERVQFFVAETLGPLAVRGIGRSMRWTWKVHPDTAAKLEEGRPVIYAHWHGRLLPLVYTHRGLRIQVLVSWNKDGELITRVIERLGFRTVRGSSSRGARAALKAMVRQGREGCAMAITPDGPRGPRHEVQDGVVVVAALTGIPVIPTAASADRAWILRSWDRFFIPKPFSRGSVVMDEPIQVPRDAVDDVDTWRLRIRDSLRAATAEADRMVGAGGLDRV